MSMNRAQFAKMLEPGLNTSLVSSMTYPPEYTPVFDQNTSQKAFEEDVIVNRFWQCTNKR